MTRILAALSLLLLVAFLATRRRPTPVPNFGTIFQEDMGRWVEPDPDYMCPNCVTPWKCNGPHEPDDGWGIGV